MALYRSGPSNQHLTDWNKMMAELFHSERRSISTSTPESSSGVVSDDHYLTISDHSESFTSPRRPLNHIRPNSSEKSRTTRTSSSTPSPLSNRLNVISHHPSLTSPPQTINPGTKNGSPVYQNLPAGITAHKKHANATTSSEQKKSENRLKKQIKSIFQVQNKFSLDQPSSRNQTKHFKNETGAKVHKGAGQTRLNDFDDGLLTRIFQRLSSNELCKCAMVCKRWYELVWNPCLWSHIVIDDRNLDVDRGIKCLTTALSYDESKLCLIVESIDLTGCHRLTDRGLYLIACRCPKLKEFVLDGCREVTNIAIFEVVSKCIDLESLSLSGCLYVTCISLTPEANLQATTYGKQIYLSHLDMTDCINVDDSSLQMIVTYCSKLSYLYLRRCVKITDVGVQYAASYCNKLQELSVSDCPNISDLGMKDISRLESNLRYLSVAKCRRISDAGLKCVARKCTKLRYLNMRGCDRITEEGLTYLAAYCNKLRSLDLGNCSIGVDDRTLEALGQCEQLRRLSLKGCSRVTDAGLIALTQNCRQLQQLNLIECRVSSKALEQIHHNCPACIVEHNNPGMC